jgi:hypothetical protein
LALRLDGLSEVSICASAVLATIHCLDLRILNASRRSGEGDYRVTFRLPDLLIFVPPDPQPPQHSAARYCSLSDTLTQRLASLS